MSNSYRELSLKEIQQLELKVLKEIDAICRKNDIVYFLMFGTLLGAIRHKGFIPWDYDIDIALLRKDFDKLMDILQSDDEFSKKYLIQTPYTDKKYGLTMTRIILKDTKFMWANGFKGQGLNGLHIDIFPFELQKIDDTKIDRRYKKKCRLNKLFYYRYGNLNANTPLRKMEKFFLRLLLSPFTYKYFVKKRLKLSKNDEGNIDNLVVSNYNDNMHFMKGSWFKEFVNVEFENTMFSIPKCYDEILTFLYHNYMKLPPVKERVHDVRGFVKDGERDGQVH